MDKQKETEVGLNSLNKARSYSKERNWKRAFPHYLMCLELFPSSRTNYEEEFFIVLCNLGSLLESENSYEDLFNCYRQALRYFPSNSHVLNNFGSHLLRLHHPDVALTYFQNACKSNPSFLLAEKNLQTCKLNIIPRWHFRMLNDSKRNWAYRCAIRSALLNFQNYRVIDIGSGCGLLSFYASECEGVESIVAIESCKILSNMTKNLLREVRVICKNSLDVKAVEVGMSNLVVTEVFDAGLFGEGVLNTLIHAWENLLTPTAKIIPSSAHLFVTGINCDIIFSKHKVLNPKMHGLNMDNLCIIQNNDEPYEAENLKNLQTISMTESKKVLTVCFSDVDQLRNINKDRNFIPKFRLKCKREGVIRAFAIWFDLNLNEDLRITTNPNEDSLTCWEQAIMYLDHPLNVVENQEIELKLSCIDGKLEIDTCNTSVCERCFKVSPNIVSFLNDSQLCELSKQFPFNFDCESLKVIDLNPFPIFALHLALQKRRGNYFVVIESSSDLKFFNFVLVLNNFNSDSNVGFKVYRNSNELFDNLKKSSIDLILINPLSQNGTLCEDTFDNYETYNTFLKPNGSILPNKIGLIMELIESDYLDFCNKVNDTNLFGFKVSRYINKFGISEQWQVHPRSYPRKSLGRFEYEINCFSENTRCNFETTSNGNANGVLCWYRLIFPHSLPIDTSKSSFYKGVCFILNKVCSVDKNSVLTINFKKTNGLLKLYVDD